MKLQLVRALELATSVMMDETDVAYSYFAPHSVLLELHDGTKNEFPLQEIEVDQEGCATAEDVDGNHFLLRFHVTGPLTQAHVDAGVDNPHVVDLTVPHSKEYH